MLGYSGVRMNYSPQTKPIRTLMPGERIPDNPDNRGATGYGGYVPYFDMTTQTPIKGDHGDSDLTQQIFENGVATGKSYDGQHNPRGFRMGIVTQNQFGVDLIREAYHSRLAQAQKLRNNVHFNMQGLTRRIVSPDVQTQFETGYTLPLQEFAFVSDKIWNSPSGRNVAGSTLASVHPTLKRAQPTNSIPTSMPWNSAPGQY